MGRRLLLAGSALALVLVVLVAATGAGVYLYREKQNREWLAMAEADFARGDWAQARLHFEWYLPRKPDDVDALKKYAEACSRLLTKRPGALRSQAVAYHQILSIEPGNREIQAQFLDLYYEMGAWAELEYYAGDVLRQYPDDKQARYYQALALERMGLREEATSAYRALIDSGAGDMRAYGGLARLLDERGLEHQASELLDGALEKYPGSALLRVERAQYYARARDWARAASELEEAERLDAEDPQVLRAKVEFAIRAKDWDAALASGEALLKKTPDDPDLYPMMAQVYLRKDGPERAVSFLKEMDPLVRVQNPRSFITLAELQIAVKDFEGAHETIDLYEKAYPNQQPFLDYLKAREYMVKDEAAQAVAELLAVLERQPDFAPAQFSLAVAYKQTGQELLSRGTMEAYLRMHPEDDQALAFLAQLDAGRLSTTELEARAQRFLAADNVDTETLLSSAVALFNAGVKEGDPGARLDVVKRLLERALDNGPQTPKSYQMYVDVLLAANDLPGARDVLRRAVEAGVPQATLYTTFARVALAENDPETAGAICERDLQRPSVTNDEIIAWARLFADSGHYNLARKILDERIERAETADRLPLEMARLSVSVRAGDSESALAFLAGIESRTDLDADARRNVVRTKIELAERMLQGSGGEEPSSAALADAYRLLGEARETAPDDPAVLALDAQLLLQEDPPDVAGAQDLFERVIEREPGNWRALSGLARVASSRGELAEALGYAQRASEAAPQVLSLRLQTAELLNRLNRYAEAQGLLKSVLERVPGNVQATVMLANSYINSQQLEAAEDLVRQVEARHAEDAKVAWLRAKLSMAQGDTGEAEAVLRKEYEADPDNASLLGELVAALTARGNSEEAEGLLRAFADRHPDFAEAWVMLGRHYLAMGTSEHLKKASTAITRALLADASYLPAIREMIEVQSRLGNRGQALALCSRYLEKAPEDVAVLHRQAVLLAQERNTLDAAVAVMDHVLALEDRDEYRFVRGLFLVAAEQYDLALRDLAPLARKGSTKTGELDTALADAYLHTGQLDLARQYLASAMAKTPQEAAGQRRRLEALAALLEQQEGGA